LELGIKNEKYKSGRLLNDAKFYAL